MDNIQVQANSKVQICDIGASGIIKHIWMTMASNDSDFLRKVMLRMWWDNEENPSVEVPIGDFFGIGHAKTENFWSLPLACGPNDGKGFNCFFPMPFSNRAIIEVENESEIVVILYFYIDYEEYQSLDEDYGRFHAMWRRENPTPGKEYKENKKVERLLEKNVDHKDDYLVLEAEGEGHYVGMNLNIHNLRETDRHNWPGEGDDYINIDNGETILYGTGTEDYFCTAWCPNQFYCSPHFGVTIPGGDNWSGKISYYRFHLEDPIYFHKNIKVKIEHGHANQRSDDWSSTAYWYQKEPHKEFPNLLKVEERIPRKLPKEITGNN